MKEFEVGRRLYRHGFIGTIFGLFVLIIIIGLVLFWIYSLFAEGDGAAFVLIVALLPALARIVRALFYHVEWVDEYENCLIGYRLLRPVYIPFNEIKDIEEEWYHPWHGELERGDLWLYSGRRGLVEHVYYISFKDVSWDDVRIPKTRGTDGFVERWRKKYLPADTTSFPGYAYEERREFTGITSAGDTELMAEIGEDYVMITGVRAGDELNTYSSDGTLLATETVSSGNSVKLMLPTGSYIVEVSQTTFDVYGGKATTDYSYDVTVK